MPCACHLWKIYNAGKRPFTICTDFIWYLRNLLLIKTTKDAERIEDVIEVSADNLEDLKKDAQNVDIDTLMYYIRVLSNYRMT